MKTITPKILSAILIGSLLFFATTSCMCVDHCPTYSGAGYRKDVLKMKARSLEKKEKKFFRHYERNNGRMVVAARK